MSKVNVYSSKGTKGTAITLPKKFSEKMNKALLAQAIRVYEDRSHTGSSVVKTRGQVKASTRKIYRQKGTGGARHGSISAPIFVGGGKAHGPKGVKRLLTLPKKMRAKALAIALTAKADDSKLVAVTDIAKLAKTKEAESLLKKIAASEKYAKNPRYTIVVTKENSNALKAFRNLANASVCNFESLNAYKVFLGGIIVIEKSAFEEKTPRRQGSVGQAAGKTEEGTKSRK